MKFTKLILTDEERTGITKAFRREQEEHPNCDPPARISFSKDYNAGSKAWLLTMGTKYGIKVSFDLGDK